MANIWFWQQIITPHMAGLAVALADRGHTITYAAEQAMSDRRGLQGWQLPCVDGVDVRILPDADSVTMAVAAASPQSIHICQGIRANGLVSIAQRALKQRGLKQWVVMETVNDRGLSGSVRKLVYRVLFLRWRPYLQGVLAIGWQTPDWVVARSIPESMVFPFAYFLPEATAGFESGPDTRTTFRFLFVGQFIERKRLDLLVDALGSIAANSSANFQLQVIGSGPLEVSLRSHAERVLGEKLDWVGRLPMEQVRAAMANADCLVLPSRHDGWGAVVSEALMAGTPAIVSDACGSADVVPANGEGGVFPAHEPKKLKALLHSLMCFGTVSIQKRQDLANWARCLGAEAGAAYLSQILEHSAGRTGRPLPPWMLQFGASTK